MFGRMRAAPSLDFLERPPSKIIKDDSLSIYEVTLIKLKQGSRHDVNSQPGVVAVNVEADAQGESMAIDTDCFATTSPDSSNSTFMDSSNQQQNKTILSMFSKYKNSRLAMTTGTDTSARISPSSSYAHCMNSREQQLREHVVVL